VRLLEPLALGPRTAPNRIVFGPHETNLGNGRAIGPRHVAYYRSRAAGGTGIVVTEEASVHESDWPYERAPLAASCGEGWARVADAVHDHGGLVLAAVGHAGGQGSSAYSQRELWAPSRVPEVVSREVPKWMEEDDIAAVVGGFEHAARVAAGAGLDGVEVNAGQHSLVRQFLSGLTNHRGDDWGTDRLRFARSVLGAARRGLGPDRVLGLRLSCDELAPWAGIVPEAGATIAAELSSLVDYVVVVRGSIFSTAATRPDGHAGAAFNVELCRLVRTAVAGRVPVGLQGSVGDVDVAEAAVANGVADLVEMTRAQIADPDLAAKLAAGTPERIRPCILCNQTCMVRDVRNPIVTCVGHPSAGHETDDPPLDGAAARPTEVIVVGGGPAGLECARVAAGRGHSVRLVERSARPGGMVRTAALGAGRERLAALVDWQEAECRRLGVDIECGTAVVEPIDGQVVVVCTGSRPGRRTYEVADGAVVVEVADAIAGAEMTGGPIVVWDPIGGPIAVSFAETLGERAVLVTPDHVAGNELARTGDLVAANARLAQAGVTIERRSVLRAVRPGEVDLEHRFTGARRTIPAAAVVDAGFRLPNETAWAALGRPPLRAGDCVAPRTIHEAVLEGRRAALAIESTAFSTQPAALNAAECVENGAEAIGSGPG
jgi:2,4-dienoyl-CoA reductase (NADPH2)